MRELIGFNLVMDAVSLLFIFLFGFELLLSDRIKLSVGFIIFLAVLSTGVYLMAGDM